MKRDRKIIKEIIRSDGNLIYGDTSFFNDDKELVMERANDGGWFLHSVSERLRDDKEVVLHSVNKCSTNFENASERLKMDKDVIFALKDISYTEERLLKVDPTLKIELILEGKI